MTDYEPRDDERNAMSDTATLIPIDRSTFRRNPEGGNTASFVSHGRYVEFIRRDGNVVTNNVSTGPVEIGPDYIAGMAIETERTEVVTGGRGSSTITGFPPEVSRGPKPFRLTKADSFRTHKPGEWVEHQPLPAWLYQYVPTFVTCRYCGAQFLHTKLETDEVVTEDGEQPIDRICPKCKEADCVELEWEKPEAVARELGLAK